MIQNDIGGWNPSEGVDAEIGIRRSSSSDDGQMRQPLFKAEGSKNSKPGLEFLIGGVETLHT